MTAEVPSLFSLCVDSILSDKRFKTTMGSLELYSRLCLHFQNPTYDKLRCYCMKTIRSTYPMLLSKYGKSELSKVLEEEDLAVLHKEYEDSEYIKRRFSALKGTIIEPVVCKVAADDAKNGHYPLAALLQGAAWPTGVDPAHREDFLSPDDFQSVFNMSRAEFRALDSVRRTRLKKEKGLF